MSGREELFVATKVPAVIPGSRSERAGFITGSVESSLQKLGISRLPLVLLHRFADLPDIDLLMDLRERGLIERAGVSVYRPEDAVEAIETAGVEAVQIPTSVLDQRFLRHGVFDVARRYGVAVFCRSAYLQGALTMSEEDMPEHLAEVVAIGRRLRDIVGSEDLRELALRYVLSLPLTAAVPALPEHILNPGLWRWQEPYQWSQATDRDPQAGSSQ